MRETRSPNRIRPAEWIAIIGILVAIGYITQKRCMLHDVEFLLIAAYLSLILAFVVCVKRDKEVYGHSFTFMESFSSSGDPSKSQTGGGGSSSMQVLYSMPGRVKDALVPSLENVANAFRGQTDDEFVRAIRDNMVVNDDEKTNEDAFRDLVRKYKAIDHLICRLQGADEEVYDKVVNKGGLWV